MKKLLVLLVLLAAGSAAQAQAQSFLRSYEHYLQRNQRRSPKQDRAAEMQLLRELFAAHQQRTSRSFDTADTLHIVMQTAAEIGGYAPHVGRIWTRTDSLSFQRSYASQPPTLEYAPWPEPLPAHDKYADIGPQLLVALVSKRQFAQVQQLAAAHRGHDGSRSQVISAVRTPKGYQVTTFWLPYFGLMRSETGR